jgi:hypothetical protein
MAGSIVEIRMEFTEDTNSSQKADALPSNKPPANYHTSCIVLAITLAIVSGSSFFGFGRSFSTPKITCHRRYDTFRLPPTRPGYNFTWVPYNLSEFVSNTDHSYNVSEPLPQANPTYNLSDLASPQIVLPGNFSELRSQLVQTNLSSYNISEIRAKRFWPQESLPFWLRHVLLCRMEDANEYSQMTVSLVSMLLGIVVGLISYALLAAYNPYQLPKDVIDTSTAKTKHGSYDITTAMINADDNLKKYYGEDLSENQYLYIFYYDLEQRKYFIFFTDNTDNTNNANAVYLTSDNGEFGLNITGILDNDLSLNLFRTLIENTEVQQSIFTKIHGWENINDRCTQIRDRDLRLPNNDISNTFAGNLSAKQKITISPTKFSLFHGNIPENQVNDSRTDIKALFAGNEVVKWVNGTFTARDEIFAGNTAK